VGEGSGTLGIRLTLAQCEGSGTLGIRLTLAQCDLVALRAS